MENVNCPACGSSDVRPNKIPETWMERVAHAARVMQARGHTRTAVIALTAFGGMHAANRYRQPWKCRACKATFGDSATSGFGNA